MVVGDGPCGQADRDGGAVQTHQQRLESADHAVLGHLLLEALPVLRVGVSLCCVGIEERLTIGVAEELDHRRQLLRKAMGVLNDLERRIFEARRLADDPITLEELSSEFGVSRERVRQIEVRAFEKVQKAVKKGARELEAPHPEIEAAQA